MTVVIAIVDRAAAGGAASDGEAAIQPQRSKMIVSTCPSGDWPWSAILVGYPPLAAVVFSLIPSLPDPTSLPFELSTTPTQSYNTGRLHWDMPDLQRTTRSWRVPRQWRGTFDRSGRKIASWPRPGQRTLPRTRASAKVSRTSNISTTRASYCMHLWEKPWEIPTHRSNRTERTIGIIMTMFLRRCSRRSRSWSRNRTNLASDDEMGNAILCERKTKSVPKMATSATRDIATAEVSTAEQQKPSLTIGLRFTEAV